MKITTLALLIAPVFSIHPEERSLVVSIGPHPHSTSTIVVLEKDAEIFLRTTQGDIKTNIVKIHEMMLGMEYFRVELSSTHLEKEDIWARKLIFIPSPRSQIDEKPKPVDR